MIYFYELVNEGEDTSTNENTENVNVNENVSADESGDFVSDQGASADTACTVVYTENFEMVCAESLVAEPVQRVEVVQTEEQIERDQTTEQLLRTLTTQQQSILSASDTTASLELSQEIHDTLTDIYDYVGLFVGLYFVGWLFAQMNSWRRNNR